LSGKRGFTFSKSSRTFKIGGQVIPDVHQSSTSVRPCARIQNLKRQPIDYAKRESNHSVNLII